MKKISLAICALLTVFSMTSLTTIAHAEGGDETPHCCGCGNHSVDNTGADQGQENQDLEGQ